MRIPYDLLQQDGSMLATTSPVSGTGVFPRPPFAWLTRNPGRKAGFTYLLLLCLSPFSLLYVPGKLFVSADPAATARNILASESLFRASISATLLTSIGFIFVARTLYRLLSHVDRSQATLMATLVYISVAVSVALALNDLAVIAILRDQQILAAFTLAQREAFAVLFIKLRAQGMLLSMIFWGLWLLPFGRLVMRSRFLPRFLGALLILNGVAYVIEAAVGIQWPEVRTAVATFLFPALFGEAWIILWLVIVGGKPVGPGSP